MGVAQQPSRGEASESSLILFCGLRLSLSLSLLSGLLVRLLLIEFFASQLAPLAEVSTDEGVWGCGEGDCVEVLHFACWLKRFISRFQTWLLWQLTRLERVAHSRDPYLIMS